MKRRIFLPDVERNTENKNAFQCRTKRKKAVVYKQSFQTQFDKLQEEGIAFFRKINYLVVDNAEVNVIRDTNNIKEWITELELKSPGTTYHRLLEEGQGYPDLPLIDRAYIQNFLRGPMRSNRERPCSNPICQGEGIGGIRCREFLLPDDPVFPDTHGMCYLCALHATTEVWLELKEKDENELINMKALAIHRFNVKTNMVGEYKLSQTIPVNPKHNVSVFGPYPMYNVNNYTKIGNRIQESETLVFRLAQEALKQTWSSQATQAGEESRFVRSIHTGGLLPELIVQR